MREEIAMNEKANQVLSRYEKKPDGTLDGTKPIKVHYDKEEKIRYYTKRMKDPSLTDSQRYYASQKVQMLLSGKGVIAITADENFKGGKGKNRRVMISGVNPKTGEKMVNRITSSNTERTMKLNRQNTPILQKDCYLDQEVHVKKKNGGAFQDADLIPTTSTIHPFDYQKVFRFIFKGKSTSKSSKKIAENNSRLGQKFK